MRFAPIPLPACLSVTLIWASPINAQNNDGFWKRAGGGSWATASNWEDNIVADGANNNAYFGSSLEPKIPASAIFTLDGARVIGNLYFIDPTTADNWVVNTGSGGPFSLANDIDLPSVTVNLASQRVTINAVLAGLDGLEKLGSGVLVLGATNSYTGETVVSEGTLTINGRIGPDAITVMGGTLGGTGTITGPVTVRAGSVLSPGNSFGMLSISNALTLQPGSTTFIEVNASTLGCDSVKGLSSATYGGALVVSNLAGTLTLGQSFFIFNAITASGNFGSVTPQLTNSLRWRFDPGDGVLSVVSTNVQPRFANVMLLGRTNLVMLVTNGIPGATNYLLASTNIALPRTNWSRLSTNVFDASGNLTLTNISSAVDSQKFFWISQ